MTPGKKLDLYFNFEFDNYLNLLKKTKYVMPAINSKKKYTKIAIVAFVLQNTLLTCFAEDECTKIYDARAWLLFCALNLLFDDFFRCRRLHDLLKFPSQTKTSILSIIVIYLL